MKLRVCVEASVSLLQLDLLDLKYLDELCVTNIVVTLNTEYLDELCVIFG